MAYFEIGIYRPHSDANVGTLWRSALQLGAAGIFTIGGRYRHQTSDVNRTRMHIPLRQYGSFEEFRASRPEGARLVGIEMGGEPLSGFCHPQQAIYLLGSETNGLPERILTACNAVVAIEAVGIESYNVAVAGSIVMYHRLFLDNRSNPLIRQTGALGEI